MNQSVEWSVWSFITDFCLTNVHGKVRDLNVTHGSSMEVIFNYLHHWDHSADGTILSSELERRKFYKCPCRDIQGSNYSHSIVCQLSKSSIGSCEFTCIVQIYWFLGMRFRIRRICFIFSYYILQFFKNISWWLGFLFVLIHVWDEWTRSELINIVNREKKQ